MPVTLRFIGPGFDVVKDVGEVEDGETLEVEVNVIGNDVDVVSVTVTGNDNSSDDDSAADAVSDDASDDVSDDESTDDESDDDD